jgi:hypothetical protein
LWPSLVGLKPHANPKDFSAPSEARCYSEKPMICLRILRTLICDALR